MHIHGSCRGYMSCILLRELMVFGPYHVYAAVVIAIDCP